LRAQVLLQSLDLHAYRRLRQVEFFRRLAKAALLCNRPENHQAEVLEACHGTIKAFLFLLSSEATKVRWQFQ
jgi:hypothetical protein